MNQLFKAWQNRPAVVIGMLHMPPLPGSPRYDGDLDGAISRVLSDAQALVEGGVHALMLENLGDAPYFPGRVPVETVSHLTAVAMQLRNRFSQVGTPAGIPLGINVLRNDGLSALAVAHAVGAQFIRVNVLCGSRATDQGVIHGIAHELMRRRRELNAVDRIKVFADVRVKHSSAIGEDRPIAEEVEDLVHRGLADAVIVTGGASGHTADVDEGRQVRAASAPAPVFVGSGVNSETVANWKGVADGFIVGTGVQHGGVTGNPVDAQRVRELISAIEAL